MNKLYALLLGLICVCGPNISAQTVYVDAVNGNDAYVGFSSSPGPFGSGPKQTLAAAMALVSPGNVIEIAPGTYNLSSTLIVNKTGVSLRGNGGAPNVRPVITGTANALIQPTAPDVTIENLNLKVNQVSCLRGINAPSDNYNGLTISDCLIESTLQDTNTNVVFESYGIYLFGSWNTTATCSLVKNVIQPEVYGTSALFGRGIRLWGARAVVGGSAGSGNVILALYGLQTAENGGPITVTHNEFNTGNVGVEINVPNTGKHTVANNVFRSDYPQNHVAHIEIKNNTRTGSEIEIFGNQINDIFGFGVLSTRSRNVVVKNNTFTPDEDATGFVMVGVNTKQRTEGSAASQTPQVNSITVISNEFGYAANYPDTGRVFLISHHHAASSFGALKFGGLGDSANVLLGNYSRVLSLDPRTGSTSDETLFPEYAYLPANSHTEAVPANVNVDMRRNQIYMASAPSGLTLPTAFNHAQMLEIENKTDHAVDFASLGHVLYKPGEAAVTAQSFIAPHSNAPSLNRALPFVADDGKMHVGTNQTFNELVEIDRNIHWISSSYTSINQLVMNGPNKVLTLTGDLDVAGDLSLIAGKIVTGAYELDLLPTGVGAVSGGSATAYVEGNLRRSVSSGFGPYAFPVGTAQKGYQNIEIGVGAVSGLSNIRVEPSVAVANLTPVLQAYCSVEFNYALDNGSWRVRGFNGVTPVSVSGNLDVVLYPTNFTPALADAYAVLREGTVTGTCETEAISLTATNVGLSVSGSAFAVAAALNCPSLPTLTLVQPEPVCASSGTITLEAISNASAFTWSGPGINDANRNLQSPSIARIPANAGTYVCVASSGPGCLTARSVDVSINANPGAPLVDSPIQICATSTVVEPGIGSGGNGLRWYANADSPNPFSTTLSMPVGTPVTYYVSTVDNATGCESERVQVVINVAPKPGTVGWENITSNGARIRWRRAPLWVSGGMAPFGVFEVQFILVAPTPGTWQTLTGIADTTVQLSGLQSGGTYQYRVRYQCLSGYSVYSDTTVVTRFSTQSSCSAPNAPTTSAAGAGNRNVNWNAIPGALSYACNYGNILFNPSTWTSTIVFTNSAFLTGLNPTVTYRARVLTNCVNANNTVLGPGASSWSPTSTSFKPNSRTAVNGMAGYYEMVVYPNPSRGAFTLSFESEAAEAMNVKIFDLAGKAVYENRFSVTSGQNEIGLETSLPAGLYILSCQSDKGRRNVKISIER